MVKPRPVPPNRLVVEPSTIEVEGGGGDGRLLTRKVAQTVKKVTDDYDGLRFNTAVAYLMEDEDAEETKRAVEKEGRRCILLSGDVADPKFCDRFQRETLLMARFQHPYAVTLYDASLNDPQGPCIVMEYIKGITLDALLERNERLSPARVGRLLRRGDPVAEEDR